MGDADIDGNIIAAVSFDLPVMGILLVIFFLLYKLRTAAFNPNKKRSVGPDIPEGIFAWIPLVLTIPAKTLIERSGLDAATYFEFNHMVLDIFAGYCVATVRLALCCSSPWGSPTVRVANTPKVVWQRSRLPM